MYLELIIKSAVDLLFAIGISYTCAIRSSAFTSGSCGCAVRGSERRSPCRFCPLRSWHRSADHRLMVRCCNLAPAVLSYLRSSGLLFRFRRENDFQYVLIIITPLDHLSLLLSCAISAIFFCFSIVSVTKSSVILGLLSVKTCLPYKNYHDFSASGHFCKPLLFCYTKLVCFIRNCLGNHLCYSVIKCTRNNIFFI